MADPDTSEDRLLSLAENYYLDLRGSFDDSVEKVQTNTNYSPIQSRPIQILYRNSETTAILQYLLIVDV